jgi:TRAP-type C4-dicarboxylate transport system permease small subunit
MKNLCNRYLIVVDVINKITGWFLALILGVMTVLIFWQVFARFVVGSPLTFSEELSRFLMIWLAMLGSSYALREGTLIAIDLLPDAVKGKKRLIVKSLISFMVIIFSVILVVQGWEMSMTVSTQIAPSTRISMFIPMFALPIGGLLLIMNSIATLIEEIYSAKLSDKKAEKFETADLYTKTNSFNI